MTQEQLFCHIYLHKLYRSSTSVKHLQLIIVHPKNNKVCFKKNYCGLKIISYICKIYKDGELEDEATRKKFFLVRQEGSRNVKREIDHYNLDMIIALGYRVQSEVAVRFRRWATQRLHEYIQKGFTMDDERLKQGGNRYFRELLQKCKLA